ncbi:MAG: FimV/HubP family polar landmark protein [Gammaproteobacteria bacterium]
MCKHPATALITGLFATFVILAPGLASALGLGQMQSGTRIGQNLQARIPILAANPNILQGLTVSLAKPDAYQQAGIREADFLFNLKFQIKRDAKGPYVLVTSSQPVRLPFLNILVHAHWASGDVTRQYTLLLNPPVFASNGSNKAKAGAPVATPSTPARQTPVERPTAPPAQPATPQHYVTQSPTPAAQQARPGTYGPVRRGQTLWGIANSLRSGASVNQMMIAIYRANPQAFSGNIDRLRAGATLRVPSRGEVAQISRTAANAQVADQIESWKAATSGGQNRIAKAGVAAHSSANQAGGSAQSTAHDAGKAAGVSSLSGGQVVLTAPKVTQSVAAGGVASKSGAAATAAVGALAAAGVARNGKTGKEAKNDGSARAAAIPAASSGGPAKLHNAELANLAAAGQAAAKKQTPAKTQSRAATDEGRNAKATGGKPVPSHRVAEASTASRLSGTVWNWLTSPKGWIIIALIVLFLILIAFLLVRRHRKHEHALMALAAGASADSSLRRHQEPMFASAGATGAAGGTLAAASGDGGTLPVSGGLETTGTEATASNEAAAADALAQADLRAGYGDYAGAARVLDKALETVPERNDLRVRLLELLFAADDGPAFLAAAEQMRRRVPESGAEWRSVAVMGRELLPDESLFAESREAGGRSFESALAGGAEMSREEEGEPDFEFELDQLNEDESADTGLADDFEHTLGELSTMIETYMPEGGERPIELHLPPGESAAEEESEIPAPDEADVALDFDLDPPATPAEAPADGERADGRSRLELAQAYLDMDDRESAHETLEAVLADGDEAQREQARRILDSMNGASAEELSGGPPETLEWAGEAGESLPADEEPPEADEPGTAMDLARAYLELGDRESARDILEEILDGDSEPQREKARELLETMN